MKYKVSIPIVYSGKLYEVGQTIDLLEKEIAKNCLERELIAEITEDVETVPGKAGEGNKDEAATGEIVERTENKEQKDTNKSNKTGKNK